MNARPVDSARLNSIVFAIMIDQLNSDRITRTPRTTFVAVVELVINSSGDDGTAAPICISTLPSRLLDRVPRLGPRERLRQPLRK